MLSFSPFVSFFNFDKGFDDDDDETNEGLWFFNFDKSFDDDDDDEETNKGLWFFNFDKSFDDDDDEETNKGLWPRGDKLSRGQKSNKLYFHWDTLNKKD